MSDFCRGILEDFTVNAETIFRKVSENKIQRAIRLIQEAKKVFVLGIGQTGCIGRILAMKLCHIGLEAYTVFDEINPPLESGDLFIAISQSGKTRTILGLAEKVKVLGGRVLAVTANGESGLAGIADAVLEIEARAADLEFPHLSAIGEEEHQNLSGALFGLNIYVLFFALVVSIAKNRKESPKAIDRRHANLQ